MLRTRSNLKSVSSIRVQCVLSNLHPESDSNKFRSGQQSKFARAIVDIRQASSLPASRMSRTRHNVKQTVYDSRKKEVPLGV